MHHRLRVPSTIKARKTELVRLGEFLSLQNKGRADEVLREGGEILSVRECVISLIEFPFGAFPPALSS